MTSVGCFPFSQRLTTLHQWGDSLPGRCAIALVLVVVLVLAYGVTVALVFNQAAVTAQPGDRLVVAFPPGTSMDSALQRLGGAGTSVAATSGPAWLYQTEVLSAGATERLATSAWVMKVPGEPSFQACVDFLTSERG